VELLTFEEQWQVLPAWWQRGLRHRTVVCLDAHLDLQRVSEPRIEALWGGADHEAVAALGKRHHLLPDAGTSYSIEDFLYPAFRLGIIDRLIWVAPPHIDIDYSGPLLERVQQMDGLGFEELTGFRREHGALRGRLLGLDVTVCRYTDLPRLSPGDGCLLDIDSDFFVEVPGDRPGLDPALVVRSLQESLPGAALVTLTRSVSSGFMPLEYRFVVDYLAALWRGSRGEAAAFKRLWALAGAATPQGLAALRTMAAEHPQWADVHCLLAKRAPDAAEAQRALRAAARLSPAHAPDPLRVACGYPNRSLPLDRGDLPALEAVTAALPAGGVKRALGAAALGLLCCACGELSRAAGHYRTAAARLGGHPELALALGERLLAAGDPDAARALLQAARGDDKTRTRARVLRGRWHLATGEVDAALADFMAAHEAAPAWLEVLDDMARAHAARGERRAAADCRRRHRARRAALEALIAVDA